MEIVEGKSRYTKCINCYLACKNWCHVNDALRVAEKKEKDMSARLLIVMSNLLSPHSIFIQPAEKRSIG